MPSFTIITTIHAPIDRVWRALCDPTEVPQWDTTVLDAIDAPADYPQPGQHLQWRIANSNALLHDRPQHVEPPIRLHSHLALNRDRLDETYTLTALDPSTTGLTCYVNVSHAIPIIGPLIARLRTLPQTRTSFATSLINLKLHCEQDP